jgi:predicted site-specific integrase-resolvase
MANATNKENDWMPLMEYAIKNEISLSTLRRHIKANKITYKVENGRYLLRSDEPASSLDTLEQPIVQAAISASSSSEVATLRAQLRKAREEIAELKMLVAIYEEQTQASQPQPTTRPGGLRMNG